MYQPSKAGKSRSPFSFPRNMAASDLSRTHISRRLLRNLLPKHRHCQKLLLDARRLLSYFFLHVHKYEKGKHVNAKQHVLVIKSC